LYSTVPQAKNKKKKRVRNSRSKGKPAQGHSLTADELTDHVSTTYITGRGGPLNEKGLERGIGDHAAKQAQYLKELNQRPALVLNADYQVCASRIFHSEWNSELEAETCIIQRSTENNDGFKFGLLKLFLTGIFLIFSIPYAFSIAPQLPSSQSLELAGCRKSHF
jgi:hypothetical protein